MTNADILSLIRFISNKTQTGNSFSTEEFNTALLSETYAHFKTKVGIPEAYQPGMPLPQQGYEITQKITDDILPFKVWMGKPGGIAPLQINSDGLATIPSDFYYPGAISYWYIPPADCDPIPESCKVDILTDQQWDDVISHPVRKPTLQYPGLSPVPVSQHSQYL